MTEIDTTFDVYSDTPDKKDPDSDSPTLRKYHKELWSKELPNRENFDLKDDSREYLAYKSKSVLVLASDSICHTYKTAYTRDMAHIVAQVPEEEMDLFFYRASTIGAYIIWPAYQIDRKHTINQSRGFSGKIKDRFDLTLECIRRFYTREHSPLYDTLNRYADFFELFGDFRGYVDFFLLQDLVNEDYSVKFALDFNGFDSPPLPANLDKYREYKENMMQFVGKRNERIVKWQKNR